MSRHRRGAGQCRRIAPGHRRAGRRPRRRRSSADIDGDGVADAADTCAGERQRYPGLDGNVHTTSATSCDDRDGDRTVDASDNCIARASQPGDQGDVDGDGTGDACDSTLDAEWRHRRRRHSRARRRRPERVRNRARDGCRAHVGRPRRPAPAPANTDGDDRIDASDTCPQEYAISNDGCPLAQVASLSAKARKRSATVKVAATRSATLTITVERKKGRRWVRVTRQTVERDGLDASRLAPQARLAPRAGLDLERRRRRHAGVQELPRPLAVRDSQAFLAVRRQQMR